MRKVPLKNYIIYIGVIFITVMLCLYVVALFNKTKEYYEKNSTLTDVLFEIIPQKNIGIKENFDNYLLENSNLIIYMSSGKNKNVKEFENELKGYIVEHKLEDDILYINLDNIDKDFIPKMLEIFGKDERIKNYYIELKQPIAVIFKDKNISSIYNEDDTTTYKFNWFLIGNGVVTND